MSDTQNGNVNTFTPVEANASEVDPVALPAGSAFEAFMSTSCLK